MLYRLKMLVILVTLTMPFSGYAVVIGSTSAVSLQPSINFPAADGDNFMSGFAWFKNGFTLEDATTTCSFDSVFPVSGTVSLNGGTLTLNQDLYFADVTTLSTAGTIIGNGHFVNYPTSITTFPSGNNTFQDCVVYINNDITLTSTLTFAGTCILNGNGHTININSGFIVLDDGATLTVTNAALKNIASNNIQCLNNAGTLILNNIQWVQSDNFIFNNGAIKIDNDVDFKGDAIFAYQSTVTSTVLANATWTLDMGFTFSYDTATSADLLQFIDASSVIILKTNALLHATMQGLNLKNGTMFAADNCAIGAEIWNGFDEFENPITVDNGITFGDCTNGANDFICNIDGGTILSIASGSWNYKNVNLQSLFLGDQTSSIFVATLSALNSYKPMNMGNSVTIFADNSTLGQAPSAPFTGSVSTEGTLNTPTLTDC